MGPKKKGKGSKLARMSDEERARYLQHRAAIEEEARSRKQQLIATFIKNKLKKEEVFSRLNVAKINQQWRHSLRILKCKELHQELDALHQWFEHTTDKKNHLIECLINHLQTAENQYSRVHQCHMETVDKLLGIFNGRISVLQEFFEDRREQLYVSACHEMEELTKQTSGEQEHLHAIIFRMQQTADEERSSAKAVHNTRADELSNHMLTELENLCNSRGARMEALWAHFQRVLQRHWEQTEDRRREYLNLRQADEENCSHIFKYHQQINALNISLSNLKNQLGSTNSEGGDELEERKTVKEQSMHLFQVLRQKLNSEKQVDRRKLTKLSDSSQSATRGMMETLAKGMQILQMMSLCKRLEVAQEESFSAVPVGDDAAPRVGEAQEAEKLQDPLASESHRRFSQLAVFWKKFNLRSIEKEALYLQCQVLENEQRQLKTAIKKYFTEFSAAKPLPAAPLTIHRPHSNLQDRRTISLKGQKVASYTGKTDLELGSGGRAVGEGSEEIPMLMHTLTIQMTKS